MIYSFYLSACLASEGYCLTDLQIPLHLLCDIPRMSMLQFFIFHFPNISYWSLLVSVATEVEVYPLIICTALTVLTILRIFSKCYGDTS